MSSTFDPKFPNVVVPDIDPFKRPHKQETVDEDVGIPDTNDDDATPQHSHHAAGRGDAKLGGAKGAADAKGSARMTSMGAKSAAALALAGLTQADADSVTRGTQPNNKFGSDSTILQKPAPLPPDATMPTARTSQLFASMNQDVQGVLGAAQPASDPESKAALAQMGGAIAQLGTAPPNSAQAQAARQAVQSSVGSLTQRIGTMLGSLASGDALAAFLLLAVENKSSGKEVDTALQDLLTQGRNNAMKQQVAENDEANKKAVAAAKKAQALAKLGPILDLIITAICLAFTALTAGAGAPLAMALIGATMGFMAGGIAGGAKNHDGFDLAGAAMGAGIGSALLGPLKQMLELAIRTALKLTGKLGAQNAAKEGTKEALEQGGKIALREAAQATENQAQRSVLSSDKLLDQARKRAKEAKNDIEEALSRPKVESTADDALVPSASNVTGKRAIDKVAAAARRSAESARSSTQSLIHAGKETADDIAKAVRNPLDTASQAGRNIKSSVKDSIDGYKESIASTASDMSHNAKEFARNPAGSFKELGKSISDDAKLLYKDPKAWAQKIDEDPLHMSDQTLERIKSKAKLRAERDGIDPIDAERMEIQMHSSRVNKLASVSTGAMQMTNQLTQAVQNYVVNMQQADAKEHMAYAKEWKVLADMLQDTWQTIQDNLSNILTNHSQVVQQATQMLNSHNQANNNVVSNIAR